MDRSRADDSRDLAGFGYRQELDRTLGRFSSFAAGFSYISILTGLFQTFYLGYGAGGAVFIWTWPMVLAGQCLVALVFAELAAHYPLSGGAYQWSKLVGSPFLGWMVGWVYLACLIVTLAAVALALQSAAPQVSGIFQLVGRASDPHDSAVNAVVLGCALVLVTTLLNAVGVRILARVNNAGVFSELVGVVVLIVWLALHARRSPAAIAFPTAVRGGGAALAGPFLASAALTASYVLYGFDTAGSLAEETADPRRTAPRAILQALGTAGVLGFVLLIVALMAAADPASSALGRIDGGLPSIVTGALGDTFGRVLLCDVLFAILVCALAVHAGAVRLVFAMARDGQLPFAPALARVSPAFRTPIAPAVVVGVLAILVLVVNVNLPKIVELVTMVAVLWANLAYLLVGAGMLWRRRKPWPPRGDAPRGLFSLGRLGVPINAAAVAWSTFMIVNVGWPRAATYGPSWQHRFAPILLTLALLAAGAAVHAALDKILDIQ
ncbi:MAG TPA: amino acid permease [Vicinamibacterales bacterium]